MGGLLAYRLTVAMEREGTGIFAGSHFYLNDYAAAIAAELLRHLR
jgi:surfactin synthase thioesterase subunit